jgi:sulfur carrier protein
VNVIVNGRRQELEDSCSVRTLLERCNLTRAACAVEVNAQLVPRPQHEEHMLSDGDRVEVVTLVGGG